MTPVIKQKGNKIVVPHNYQNKDYYIQKGDQEDILRMPKRYTKRQRQRQNYIFLS